MSSGPRRPMFVKGRENEKSSVVKKTVLRNFIVSSAYSSDRDRFWVHFSKLVPSKLRGIITLDVCEFLITMCLVLK